MIGDWLLRIGLLPKRLLLGASALGAKSSMALASWHLGRDALSARAHEFLEPFTEPGEGNLSVAKLASLLLADDDDPTRAVMQPDRGFAAVDILSARSTRPKGLHIALGKKRIVGLRNPHLLSP